MISDSTAKQIAADWHGGQSSAIYALCSSGAILAGCRNEILKYLLNIDDWRERGKLQLLLEYVEQSSLRGPQEHWDKIHW